MAKPRVEVQGYPQVMAKLSALGRRSKRDDDRTVSVGYTASYATHVHEDLEAFHPVGQAKFLEQPARELRNDGTLGRIVTQARRQGQTTAQALVLAGLRIQRESQQLVPVDTGYLKSSAFTRIDGE